MVYLNLSLPQVNTGFVITRNTGSYAGLLIIESLFGTIVALSNIMIISVMIAGWKKLMKNNFYVVLANLILFTSLKAIVELGFILPYYIMQSNGERMVFGYFSKTYEFLIFNASVLSDYGVLFFSVLIAINRAIAVTKKTDVAKSPRRTAVLTCIVVWVLSVIFPFVFFVCECQYAYSLTLQLYYNKCKGPPEFIVVIDYLIYLSYACCVVVMLMYLYVFWFLRKQRRNSSSNTPNPSKSSVQMKLLRQSVVVFLLYAASISCVLICSFVPLNNENTFVIAYAENLLNLSIAAIYPICFLLMSGEMKTVFIAKIVPVRSDRVASISLPNNNNNNHNQNNNQHDGNNINIGIIVIAQTRTHPSGL